MNFPGSAPDVTISYDANGNLLTANRGISSWTYSYDVMDQLTEEELVVDGRTYEARYDYESDGRFRSIRTPAARLVYALPDGHGRARGARWGGFDYAGSATYHPSGQLATAALGNGLTYSATFNSRHQMMDLIVAGGGTNAVDFSYNYDANGRVTHITDHATPTENRAFTYDALGRLGTASGPWGAGSYSYDLLNNIRSKSLGPDTVEIE